MDAIKGSSSIDFKALQMFYIIMILSRNITLITTTYVNQAAIKKNQ